MQRWEKGMRRALPEGFLRGSAAVFLAAWVGAAGAGEYDPWSLRDHYSFSGEGATFSFDVKTAQWKVDVAGVGTVFGDVGAQVLLEDGTEFFLSDVGAVSDEREETSVAPGVGTRFQSVFAPHHGLTVRYAVARFRELPFLLLYMDVENRGDRPIALSALRPAVLLPGGSARVDGGGRGGRTPLLRRGGFPVLAQKGRGGLVSLDFGTGGSALGLGVVPAGGMDSRVSLSLSGGSWQGHVECRLDPPVRLAPGDRIEADPVWVAFGIDRGALVRQLYAWTLSAMPGPNWRANIPAGWVTAQGGDPAEDLYRAVRRWAGTNVAHALVPAGWEGRPGSLEGAVPRYPERMREVASALRELGMKPGLTVDPLLSGGGQRDWTALSEDGTRWLNPSKAEARRHGTARMKKVVGWGFEFLVVAPSAITDEVLRRFNLTRAQADSAAFELAAAAARGLPVLPSSSLVLGGERAPWEEAAEATSWFEAYGLTAGPVQFKVDGLKRMPVELVEAVRAFAGPLELLGEPTSRVRSQLSALFPVPGGAAAGSAPQERQHKTAPRGANLHGRR